MTARLRLSTRPRRRIAAWAAVLMPMLASAALADPITFLTARSSGLAVGDYSRAAGDFNGDGRLDIAVGDNALSVCTNVAGTFGPKTTLIANGQFKCVAAGDLNGDGRADLVAGGPTRADGSLAVLLSNGPGFDPPVFVNTDSAGIVDVQLGDLDGDGDRDLIAVNSATQRMSRLFNDGAGVFGALISASWPSPVSRAWLADLTGDGAPDIVSGIDLRVAIPSQDSTYMQRNLGGGTFSAPLSTGLGSARALADFNGDGAVDAFVDPRNSQRGIARGRGDGTFEPPVVTTGGFYFCSEPFATSIDVNGDGRSELVFSIGGACTPGWIALFRIDDSLHLVGREVLSGWFGVSPLAVDVDGDGRSDLLATDTLYPNYGGRLGGLRAVTKYDAPGVSYENIQDVDVADMTGDGLGDLLITSLYYTGAEFVNAGGGAFLPGIAFQPQSYIRSTEPLDIDGDGDLDLFLFHNDPGLTLHIYSWINDGSGHAAQVIMNTMPHASESPLNVGNYSGLVFADFDGDGDPDVLSREQTTQTSRLFLNDGTGTLTMQICTLPIAVSYFNLDGDGLPDALSTSGDSLVVALSTGIGAVGPSVATYAGGPIAGSGSGRASFADVNGDAIPDAVFMATSGTLMTRLGAPGGAWGALVPSGGPAMPAGLTPFFRGLGDLDGDGALDVLFTDTSRLVASAHRNLGGGVFGDRGDSYSSQPIGPMMADTDGDHAAELLGIVAPPPGHFSHAVSILLNAGGGGSPTPTLVANVTAEGFADHARLEWQLSGIATANVRLQRRPAAGAWAPLATLTPDGLSRVTYEDRAVSAGARYGYRLIAEAGAIGEVWVTIPARAPFAIERAWPNPLATGTLRVRFTVDRSAPVEAALLDIAGRRVAGHTVAAPEIGAGQMEIGVARDLRPGLYFLQLRQAGRRAETRVVVTR